MRNDLTGFTPRCLSDRWEVSLLIERLGPLFDQLPHLLGIDVAHAWLGNQYEMIVNASYVCQSIIPGEKPHHKRWDTIYRDLVDPVVLFDMTHVIADSMPLSRAMTHLWQNTQNADTPGPVSTLIMRDAILFQSQSYDEILAGNIENGRVNLEYLTEADRGLVMSVLTRKPTSNHDGLALHRRGCEAVETWRQLYASEDSMLKDHFGLRLDDPRPAEMLAAIKETV